MRQRGRILLPMPGPASLPPPKKTFALSVSGRVLLFTVVVWVGLLGGLHLVLERVFRPTFENVESGLLLKDLERVEAAVARETEQLGATARDYASWDDMRGFLENGQEQGLPTALNSAVLKTLDLDAIFVLDPIGREKHSVHEKSAGELAKAKEFTAKAFASQFPVIASAKAQGSSESAPRRGLLRFSGDTLVFAAAAPIVSREVEGKVLGTVIMLRELDAEGIVRLGEQVRLPLSLAAATPQGPAPQANEAKTVIAEGLISASAWIRDPFGKPIARFEVERPASILAEGEDTLALGGLGSLFMLSVVLAMLLLLLQLSVVRPLRSLTRKIEEVRRTGDLELRLGINRHDEIGLLAYNFDRLLVLLSERTQVLEELATTDGLTKLWNRRSIMAFLESSIEKEPTVQHQVSVLMLDVDHFKRVNDTAGHTVGDRVLRQVAETLRRTIGPENRAGRYGGEEFLVVLPKQSKEDAAQVAERVRLAISQTLIQGLDWKVTVSIGVAAWSNHSVHGLLATADINLYRAKEAGRNQVIADDVEPSRLPVASVPPPAPHHPISSKGPVFIPAKT